jgi:hypothetical protein
VASTPASVRDAEPEPVPDALLEWQGPPDPHGGGGPYRVTETEALEELDSQGPPDPHGGGPYNRVTEAVELDAWVVAPSTAAASAAATFDDEHPLTAKPTPRSMAAATAGMSASRAAVLQNGHAASFALT